MDHIDTTELLYKSTLFSEQWSVLATKPLNVTIFGAGAFGTALATVSARAGHNVIILTREENTARGINEDNINYSKFPKHKLLPTIKATTDIQKSLLNCELIIHCIPCQETPFFLEANIKYIPSHIPFISTSKGILVQTQQFMSEYFSQIFPKSQPLAYLSGPSFAYEIMEGHPMALVLASSNMEISKSIQYALSSKYFRLYASTDVIGVEIGGAIKNPLAIAAGMLSGLNYGQSSLSTLVTRGLEELRRLTIAMNGSSETLMGLSGVGDLMLTSFSSLSRNRTLGFVMTSKNLNLNEAKFDMNCQTIEGVATAKVAKILCKKYNIDMPVFCSIADILDGKITPNEALENIMQRPLGVENRNS